MGPEILVGVCAEPTPDFLLGILAVLKAGGAYLPLDPSYPKSRLDYMRADSGASVLLTQGRLAHQVEGHAGRILYLDSNEFDAEPDGNLTAEALPGNLCYMIYTSGSTGDPKGVLIRHENLHCSVTARIHYYHAPVRRFLLLSPFSFDSSAAGIFWTLRQGGALVLASAELRADPVKIGSTIVEEQISHTLAVPSLYALVRELGPELPSLETAIVAGEPCPAHLIGRRDGVTLYNEYGPTEATVWSSVYRLEGRETKAPIGRPIPYTRLYVLDTHGQPLPIGAPGELYIGGGGLARGYHRRPDLTALRFVPNPFDSEACARLYRTGDRVRWSADGQLEILGRVDQQIKLRGYRIELGEIEAVLTRHESVNEAVALIREEPSGNRRLAVYARVAEPPGNAAILKSYLAQNLPAFMTPSVLVTLNDFPRLPNGKIDRNALSRSVPPTIDRDATAPSNRIERKLVEIWAQVLELEAPFGIHDSFFDLGGHSLIAARVLARFPAAFGVSLPMRALFQAPTVAGLAELIAQARRAERQPELPTIEPVAHDAPAPLSFAQQRLWFLDQLNMAGAVYNMPFLLELDGPLQVATLARSLKTIVLRQETLGAAFPERDGKPIQVFGSGARIRLCLVELGALPTKQAENAADRLAVTEAARPFSLQMGPLLRLALLRLAPDRHRLVMTMHHIISDGWSMGVLVSELATVYRAHAEGNPSPLAPLPVRYADYAAWQHRYLTGPRLERQIAYWKQQLAGVPALLELPTDRPRPPIQTFRGATRSFAFDNELSARVKMLANETGTTLFMTLQSAFAVLLSRYSGQKDIVLGVPAANRKREELEPLIGLFVNTLVLRNDLSDDPFLPTSSVEPVKSRWTPMPARTFRLNNWSKRSSRSAT